MVGTERPDGKEAVSALRSLWLAGLLATVQVSFTSPVVAQVASADLQARIETQAQAGDYQVAMALVHGIADDSQRFAAEADLLFRARSYRAALGRAQEAYAGGIKTPLLLARGLGAGLWVGDTTAAESFLAPLEVAVAALEPSDREGWEAYVQGLRGQLAGQIEQERGLARHVGRAKWVVAGVLVMLALGLGLGLKRRG